MCNRFSILYSRMVKLALATLCSCALLGNLPMQAQNTTSKSTVTIHVKSQTMKEAIKMIEQKTSFKFFYNNQIINLNQKVTVNVSNGNINQVLDQLLSSTNLTYNVDGNIIVLYKKAAKVKKVVKGIVVDDKNYPVIGANITEVGNSTNGAISDLDGKFSIELSSDDAIMEISYIGFNTLHLAANFNKDMKIVLREDSKQLEGTIVVAYGTQDKKTMTGAASVVSTKDMELNTVTSISHALAGKAAGFNVSQVSAQPGGGVDFNIRGAASTGAGNAPLFVIDGFPVHNQSTIGSGNIYDTGKTDSVLESLNPDDIESITVLKDAASTAIYGARAGHGVILITTKRGKKQAPRITYSGMGSVQSPRTNFDMLDTQDFMRWINITDKENWMKSNGQGIYSDYIKAPANVPQFKERYSEEQIRNAKGTDWLKEVSRLGYMHQHSLSVNGGTESTRYLASINFMNQEGIIKRNGVKRMTARLNLDQEVGDYFTLGFTANFSHNSYDNIALNPIANESAGVISSAVSYNPIIPIYDEEGKYMIDPFRPWAPNPVSLLDIKDVSNKNRIMGSAYILARPIKGLELKAQVGADLNAQKRKAYLPKSTLRGEIYGGKADITHQMANSYNVDLTAQYANKWGDHSFKALAGYSYNYLQHEAFSASNRDFLIDGFSFNNIGQGNYAKPGVSSWAGISSMKSAFTRVNYSYGSRYILEATLRADAASIFHKDHRWGFFPSVSGAWVISEENFMASTKNWLSTLKLRASYGETGNSNIGYKIEDFFAMGGKVHLGDGSFNTVTANQLGNKNITWETTREFNIGLDMGFFNDRLRISGEYFRRVIDDLLVGWRPLPSYNEINHIAGNSGKTQSQGFELTINTVNYDTRDFGWNTDFTLSHYEDRWLERDPWWKPAPYQKVDDPIRGVWSYNAQGILQPGEKAPAHQKNLLPGMMKLEDVNGDGHLNQEDLIYRGSSDPKVIFGLNNTFRYKNLDFSIYFYGRAGMLRTESYYETWTNMNNHTNASTYMNEVFYSGNLEAKNPTFLIGGNGFGNFYERNIYFIRCGSITLGYRIPINKSIIKNMRIYADVHNPFVITNWTGLDPETDNNRSPYPNITAYNFGVSISF